MSTTTKAVFTLPSGRAKTRERDMSHVAQDFRTALSKCDYLVAFGRHKEALEVMVKSLVIDRTRRRDGQKAWKLRRWADIKDPITELFRLAFSLRVEEAGDLLHEMWQNLGYIRDNMRGNPNAEDIWTNVTGVIREQLVALLDDAKERLTSALDAPSMGDELVAESSGRSLESIVRDRFSVDSFVANVVNRVTNPRFMGSTMPMLRLALTVCDWFVVLTKDYELTYSAQMLSKGLLGQRGYLDAFLFSSLTEYATETGRNARQNEQARVLRESRSLFEKDVSAMEHTFEVALRVEGLVYDVSNWHCLTDSVQMIARILLEFLSEETPAHLPLIVSTYKALGELFLKCENRTFHALCLSKAAAAQVRLAAAEKKAAAATAASAASSVLSTAAVLAVLAAPDISERRNQFGGNDADFRRFSEIADMFKLAFPPSRKTLCADVRGNEVLTSASPVARQLFALLTAAEADAAIGKKCVQLLDELEGGVPAFEATFGHEIRRFCLTRHLVRAAMESNSVNLLDPAADVGFRGDATAVERAVYKVLLEDLNVPVLVDQETSEVTFTTASLARMHATFSALSEAAAPAAKAAAVRRAPLPVSLEELEIESNRLIAYHSLVKERANRTVELKQKRVRHILAQKEAKKQAVINDETQRQKAQQEENNKRLAREYMLAELKERRRLLISRMQEKHKGLKVDLGIVDLNQTSFMDNLTAALTDYQRKLENAKRADVRRMDHFERACREVDIPKRKEIGDSMAAEHEAERQTRWENFLQQHRKEHDDRVATRAKLQKFLAHAEKHERQLNERSGKTTTKRDQQEELLREEKARLAGGSAMAAAPAAPPTGPPTSTKTLTPDPAGVPPAHLTVTLTPEPTEEASTDAASTTSAATPAAATPAATWRPKPKPTTGAASTSAATTAAPASNDAAPASNDAAPDGNDAAPAENDAAPAADGAAPAGNGATWGQLKPKPSK